MVRGICLLTILLVGALGLSSENDVSFFYRRSSPRIFGGTPADSVPYMVALSYGLLVRSFICGGSLITTRTVLTAAHCARAVYYDGSLSSTLRVTVGTSRWNVAGVNYRISKNITHPNYVEDIIKNDIALLITAATVKLSNSVRTVPLHYGFVGGDVEARLTGWGLTEGDSGSPLVRVDQQRQIGIVSWGLPCGLGAPDMFVRISAFKDWLQRNVR